MQLNEQLYVGFQRERYDTADEPRLLGFAVPYNNTQSSKKRQQTVDNWRQKDLEPRIIDNKPTRGFKLCDVVSRYSTSNKLFRVLDPRGFELEISADNLFAILGMTTVVKGEIIDECVWMGDSGKQRLVSTSDPLYTQTKAPTATGGHKVGMYYASPGNLLSVFRFEGIWHNTYLETAHKATKAAIREERAHYYDAIKVIHVTEYETSVNILMNSPKNPTYIYTEFRLDANGNATSTSVHGRKSLMKKLVEYESDITDDMKEFEFNPMAWLDVSNYYDPQEVRYASKTLMKNFAFFKTKEEAKAFDYSDTIAKLTYTDSYTNRLDISRFYAPGGIGGYYYRTRESVRVSPDVEHTFCITDRRGG